MANMTFVHEQVNQRRLPLERPGGPLPQPRPPHRALPEAGRRRGGAEIQEARRKEPGSGGGSSNLRAAIIVREIKTCNININIPPYDYDPVHTITTSNKQEGNLT